MEGSQKYRLLSAAKRILKYASARSIIIPGVSTGVSR
jgi:hypothetical protein